MTSLSEPHTLRIPTSLYHPRGNTMTNIEIINESICFHQFITNGTTQRWHLACAMKAHGNQSIELMLSTYTTRNFIVVFTVNTFLLILKSFCGNDVVA